MLLQVGIQAMNQNTSRELNLTQKDMVRETVKGKYSQTCANDHLRTTTTCQQRPTSIRPSQN
jgi:hypothetical protein